MSAERAAPAVEARGLCRRYGARLVVDHLDLQVERGEVFGFLGSNGAGKSTTIRMLSGLLAPSAGDALVCGHSIRAAPERIKERIGYMSQAFGLYQDLTVAENLTFFAGLRFDRRPARRARVEEMIARFGLGGYRGHLAAALSGGWKQRLALACSVVHGPELVFLDEPTAGIDPVSRRLLWDELYQLSAAGTTLFVTTHYMEEAERCHRIGFIHAGRQLACDTPQALRTGALPGVLLRVRLGAAADGRALQEALVALRRRRLELGLDDVNLYGDELHAVVPAAGAGERARAIAAALRADGRPAAVDPIPASIEDVFVALSRLAERGVA